MEDIKLYKQNPKEKSNDNTNSRKSTRTGVGGIIETFLRRFRILGFLIALIPLYFVSILAMGISASPGVYLIYYAFQHTAEWSNVLRFIGISTSMATAYFMYGMCLIFIVPMFNFLLPFRLKSGRGGYFSLQSIPWFFHNALTYIVRYTFLEFITPTPLNTFFYRMMGMKMGKSVHINTTNISDPALIEIGDHVTIGGSAHLLAHYGQKGYLVLSKIKIASGVTIGIKATIMGDVEIGENSVIAPHEVILPKSRIPANRKPAKKTEIVE
jgi:hypothetical protein